MSEVVAGRYELGVSLGAGGMGRVVTARDRVLDRTVAVKLVPVEQARSADPALTARFVAEARTAARFTHRHVVTVYDAGESDGYLYIVTEFVDGTTLAHRLAERGALGVDESVRVGEQLLSALGAAHQAGIVHRDVKPSNVLLDANGNVKLADFGIAKRLDDLEAALTAAGEFVGTPRYVAPEQAAGQRATPATDLYAVGVVMYEMLSGEAPFHAETPIATLLAHRDAPVPDVRQTRPEVPAALAAAITTAMAKQPADRFGSAGEMRTAITSSATSIPADPTVAAAMAIPVGATAAYPSLDPLLDPPTQAFGNGGASAAESVPTRNSRNQVWWWAAVAAILIVGIVAIAQAGGGNGDDVGGGEPNASDPRRGGAGSGPPSGVDTDAPTTSAPSTGLPSTAPATTVAPTAAPTTAAPTTPPPSTEPPATEPAPPSIPALPADLDGLIDVLASNPSVLGSRGDDLLSALESVADENSDDQSKAASEAIRDLDKWVRQGELDAGAAATTRSVLAELADKGDNGNGGNGDDEGGGDD